MAAAEEVKVLSKEVNNLSNTIVSLSDVSRKDQVDFKKFLKSEREELSFSIDVAAEKLDKSSRASFWLSLAIGLFACVEAGSIFYDVIISNRNYNTTDCVAIAESFDDKSKVNNLSKHEREIASFLKKRFSAHNYMSIYIACKSIDPNTNNAN